MTARILQTRMYGKERLRQLPQDSSCLLLLKSSALLLAQAHQSRPGACIKGGQL